MKRIILLVLLLFSCVGIFSQNIPEIKLDKGTILVKKLKINVEITGDIAVTTYDMSFYNSTNRILEGELNFPLGENQSVTRFALGLNGTLREAVVVEKEKARVAFEATVRDKIDPALLEQGNGNNYKTRIYPIPSKGYKRVVLAYQQKLIRNEDSYYYQIPFSFKYKLEEYALSINIVNQHNKPIVNTGLLNDFKLDVKKKSYSAKINRKKYKVSKPVLIKIPLNIKRQKIIESNKYFYFTKTLKLEKRNRTKPKEITLFWDNSLSQKNKKKNTEIEFLEAYFKWNKNVKVNLVFFNIIHKQKKTYSVTNSNWAVLKMDLKNTIYDGATSFDFFNIHEDNSQENYVFTNGLNTLSNIKINITKPTYFVNSIVSADHIRLKYLANNSGGNYINLQQVSVKNAILNLIRTPIQILGTNFSKEEIEIFPNVGSVIAGDLSISGKMKSEKKDIKLYLGAADDTLSVINFELKGNNIKRGIIKSIWVQRKINDLVVNAEKNESEIINLSKENQVISPFTSLLILDRIQDYVAHEVVPPVELQEKYYELLSLKTNNKKERLFGFKRNLESTYNVFSNWINNKKEIKKSVKFTENVNRPVVINNTNNDTIDIDNLGRNEMIISGVVNDDSGPLPGVSVLIKGTVNGTETDFDGKFSLVVKRRDVLIFSYLGYVSVERRVRSNRAITITLTEDSNVLDEVVVVAYGRGDSRSKFGNSESIDANKILHNNTSKLASAKIDLKSWNPNTPYLKELNKIKNTDLAYKKYLVLREKNGRSPSFFIDVADYFKNKNELEIAKLILSNVAEIDLGNFELLKALAYKFEEYELWNYAVFTYKKILKIRPEDVQSYRDLALAYEGTKEYQKSLNLLYRIVKGEFLEKDMQRRFKGVEVIALQELNRLIKLYNKKLEYSYIDKRHIINSAVEIRIVIDWNHNDTDIDLWVYEPNKEKCFYGNRKTVIGGYMSNDMTRGFGPEQYVLKSASKGTYKIDVNYYGDSQQKISGPTFLKVTTFVNYGQKNEVKKVRLIRLSNKKKEIQIGTLNY